MPGERSRGGLARLWLARAGLEFEPLAGVDVHSVDVKNPVKMRASGAAGGASVSEDVAALNLRARRYDEFGHVEIHGFEALAVVNADGVAEHIKFLRESDSACCDRADGFAGWRALVNAAVIFAGSFTVVKTFDAKWRGHAAGDGRSE